MPPAPPAADRSQRPRHGAARALPSPSSSDQVAAGGLRKAHPHADRKPAALVGPCRHRARPVHGDHGHLDHRRRAPRDPGRRRFHARHAVVGLQRLRRRLRRPPAARRPTLRPARRQAHLRARLGHPGRRLARRRPRRLNRRRDRRPRRPGRRRRADRTVRPDAADDALRLEPEGAHEGLRRLRRRRPGRRHRRRVPRRRDHRVDQLAVDLLHQHPGRPARARAHARLMPAAPARRGSIDILGAAHRHRRPGPDRLRHRPRARGGWGSTATVSAWPAASRCSPPSSRCRPSGASR